MVIIISRSFASQKVLEAVTEIIDDTDSSVSAVNIETGAGFQDCKVPVFIKTHLPSFYCSIEQIPNRADSRADSQVSHLPGNFLLKTSVKNPYLQCAAENTLYHYWEIVKSDFKILCSYVQFNLDTHLPTGKNCASYLFISASFILAFSCIFPLSANALWAFGMQNE